MGSSRLPGKSMMPLFGEPLVGRILERLKKCKQPDLIVLAIPNTKENLPLKHLGDLYNVKVFLGDENDVLSRYFYAAKLYSADLIVRFPADNPVPEPLEVDKIINHHIKLQRKGFSSNLAEIFNSGYPDGIGAEVFDFSLLEDAFKKPFSSNLREHVHLNFFDYSTQKIVDIDNCPVSTIKCPVEFNRPDLILDVNTIEQYNYMKSLYDYLYSINPNFHITDIIKWHDHIYLGN